MSEERQDSVDELAHAIGERIVRISRGEERAEDLSRVPATPPFDQLTAAERERIEAILREARTRPS